jgi:gas vesicle protein
MVQHKHTNDSSTESAKEDIQAIKNDIDSLLKRLNSLKGKSGDVVSEQVEHLFDSISDLKNKGEKKGEEVLGDIVVSTRKNPIRNLACAFGLGVLISLIIK